MLIIPAQRSRSIEKLIIFVFVFVNGENSSDAKALSFESSFQRYSSGLMTSLQRDETGTL